MPLPRPDVDVTHSGSDFSHTTEIKISRDGKDKIYSGAGYTSNGATKDAVKKLLDDPHTAEFLPEAKRS